MISTRNPLCSSPNPLTSVLFIIVICSTLMQCEQQGHGDISVKTILNALEIFDKDKPLKRVLAHLSKIEENCAEGYRNSPGIFF